MSCQFGWCARGVRLSRAMVCFDDSIGYFVANDSCCFGNVIEIPCIITVSFFYAFFEKVLVVAGFV